MIQDDDWVQHISTRTRYVKEIDLTGSFVAVEGNSYEAQVTSYESAETVTQIVGTINNEMSDYEGFTSVEPREFAEMAGVVAILLHNASIGHTESLKMLRQLVNTLA